MDLGSVNRRMIESLIKAGAMDSLEGTRSRSGPPWKAPWRPGSARNAIVNAARWACSAKCWMPTKRTPLHYPTFLTDRQEKLGGEKELLGFWVTGHPLDRYMDKVAELASHDSSNLDGLAKNTEVVVCGVLPASRANAIAKVRGA